MLIYNSLLSGYGIGSFLGGLYRFVMPLIKKGAPIIGKELMKSSANILTDVVDRDKTFKESFRKRGRESLKNLTHEAVRGLSGSGLPQ